MSTPINTIEDLAAIPRWAVSTFHLVRDLDFNDDGSYADPAANKPTYTTGTGWTPLREFYGVLDGQGHTISNLFINRPATDFVALFDRALGNWQSLVSVIKDLTLADVNITGKEHVAAFVAHSQPGSYRLELENCHVTGSVTGTNRYVGGLIGRSSGNAGHVHYCSSTANITGTSQSGGLVGLNDFDIWRSWATGNVTGAQLSGNWGENFGGLVGSQGNNGGVRESFATGNVSGGTTLGGLIGSITGGSGRVIANNYATGVVEAEDPGWTTRAAGCVGIIDGTGQNIGPVSNMFSTGNASSKRPADTPHGFADRGLYYQGSATGCFWDKESSGNATSHFGTGINTTAEAQSLATYTAAGWDIVAVSAGETNEDHIWNIVEGRSYPFLSWQENPIMATFFQWTEDGVAGSIGHPDFGAANLGTSITRPATRLAVYDAISDFLEMIGWVKLNLGTRDNIFYSTGEDTKHGIYTRISSTGTNGQYINWYLGTKVTGSALDGAIGGGTVTHERWDLTTSDFTLDMQLFGNLDFFWIIVRRVHATPTSNNVWAAFSGLLNKKNLMATNNFILQADVAGGEFVELSLDADLEALHFKRGDRLTLVEQDTTQPAKAKSVVIDTFVTGGVIVRGLDTTFKATALVGANPMPVARMCSYNDIPITAGGWRIPLGGPLGDTHSIYTPSVSYIFGADTADDMGQGDIGSSRVTRFECRSLILRQGDTVVGEIPGVYHYPGNQNRYPNDTMTRDRVTPTERYVVVSFRAALTVPLWMMGPVPIITP